MMRVKPLLATVVALAVVLIAASVALAASRGASATNPTPEQVRAILARLHITPTVADDSYRIPSSSMEPTLHCARDGSECGAAVEDHILVRPYETNAPHRGDIVVFRTPPLAQVRCGAGGTFVKRVIALPGDRFEERRGYVYINGKRVVAEPYVTADRRDSRTLAPVTIPLGRYFVMGDNRASACDSRAWGTVPAGNIIGRAIAIWWPAARARRL
jgi:signal peptidase I